MPKSNEIRILYDEKKILDILQTNAQESIDSIAKKCGFSRQKVWRIIKKLEAQKTIWGFTTIIDEERYNLKHFTMIIKRSTAPIDEKIIQEILMTRLDELLPEPSIKIEHIEYVNGIYDGIFTFYAPDLITAKKFCERFQTRFSGYVTGFELLEGIFFIRRQMLRNPHLKKQLKYL
jgi:DNA-binding Lrp family transcriptional regulator